MNTDKLLYWRRTIEVTALLAALVLTGLAWKNAPPAVVPAILALLGVALGVGQSPIGGNPSTTIKSMSPPAPDAPRFQTDPCPPPDMMSPNEAPETKT